MDKPLRVWLEARIPSTNVKGEAGVTRRMVNADNVFPHDFAEAPITMVETPVFEPVSGELRVVSDPVVLSCETEGAAIQYRIKYGDGEWGEWLEYSGAFTLGTLGSAALESYATLEGFTDSEVAEAAFTVIPIATVATPGILPESGELRVVSDAVSLSCDTEGATVWYRIKYGDGNWSEWLPFDETFTLDTLGSAAVECYATKYNHTDSEVAEASFTVITIGTVATPSMSIAGGTFNNNQSVTLACATPGAEIHFTTNGATPTEGDTLYSGAINISGSCTLKAKAFLTNYTESATAAETYTLKCETPAFNPESGERRVVTDTIFISCSTSGAVIQYRIKYGSGSWGSWATYSGAFTLDTLGTAALESYATKDNYGNSDTAEASFTVTTIGTVAAPTFSGDAQQTLGVDTVTIECSTPGAVIHYTTNGDTPTEASATYSAPLALTSNAGTVVKAIAVKTNYSNSAVATSGTFYIYHATSEAYLAAMTGSGDTTYQKWIDDFVRNMDGHGLLSLADSIWLFCNKADSGDAVPASFVNLVNPTGTKASKINSPAYTTYGGWSANGGNNGIDLGVTLGGGKYALNSASLVVLATSEAHSAFAMGVKNTTNNNYARINPRNTSNKAAFSENTTADNVATGTNTALLTAVTRVNNEIMYYKDGAYVETISSNVGAIPTGVNMIACSFSNGGTIVATTNTRVIKFIFIGSGLTGTQQSNLYNDVAAWIAAKPA